MAIWPVGLPQYPIQAGYEESQPNNVVRTPMEAGPAKQRRRYTARVRPFMLALELTSAELDLFEAFYESTLADGALPFEWVHPRTQAVLSFRFIGGQPPKWNAIGWDLYTAILQTEVLP